MCDTSQDIGTGISSSPFTCAQGAIDTANDLGEAVLNLMTFWIDQGVPFTSGHLTHAIREARSDLRFRHGTVGEISRDAFESGVVPSYDDGIHGDEIRPMRKMRPTTRTDTRTPVGSEVYVIGPDEVDLDTFEFEINIAEAPQVADGQGGQVSAAAALLNATPKTDPSNWNASVIPPVTPSGKVAVANGQMIPGIPLASVHADGRLCVPRVAFEALAFETGDPITGGQPLGLTVDGTSSVSIFPNVADGDTPVSPTTDRLRMHLRIPGLTVGDRYEVAVSSEGLVIKL